jgi:N-acetylglucosaminyldiphosphoundecaprenol N-acetyl-beta-D-mannosaminyltransferase
MANTVRRINVLGVGISEIDHAAAVERIREAIESGRKGYVTVTGVHGVTECQRDDELRRIHNESFLSTPDGMPMVWMGRLAGSALINRVYGPDMMLNVMRDGVSRGWRHFLFGGGPGVADRLKECLESRIPGIQIVGVSSPPFRPLNDDESADLARRVALTRPHCFWVGLSTPKQERFMHGYLPRLDTCLMFGVGAAFDFHAGLVPQAPAWMQRAGLEWCFRLCKEPRRLWRRYVKIVPSFLVRAALQLSGLRRYDRVPDELGRTPGEGPA